MSETEKVHRAVFSVAGSQANAALLQQLQGEISVALQAGVSFERFRARWLQSAAGGSSQR